MASFGLDAAGTNVQTFSGDRSYLCKATPSTGGVVTNGRGRVRITATGSTVAKMVIYSDSGGEPNAPIAVSDEVTVNWTTSTETNFPFSGANQITVVASTDYWIGFIFDDPGTPSFEMKRNNTADLVRYKAVTYPTTPNPFSADGNAAGPLNAVIDYTEGATTTKTIDGVARIEKSVAQTVTGKGRVEKTVAQTITGVALIGVATTQTIDGVARITKTTSQTITGVARIQKSVSQTIDGVALISTTTTKTITGIARITADTTDEQYLVGAAVDDARNVNGNGVFANNATTHHLGKFSTTDYWNGWRWLNVDIPADAIIDSATIDLYSAQITAGSLAKAIFYGVAEDNVTAFANTTGDKPEGKARTTAFATKDFTVSQWSASAGFGVDTIDVTDLVQEIISRAGWASGNALAIVGHDNGSASNNYIGYSTYDRATDRGAKLNITYHTAGSVKRTITGVANIQNSTTKTITGKAAIAGAVGTWNSYIMGWIYPGQANADDQYRDGRTVHFLKPEYYTLSRAGHQGTLYRVDIASGGEVNSYSPENLAEVKSYCDYVFTTVSSNRADMQTFLGNTAARNAGITTLVNFCVDEGIAGIELDWEGYGQWTLANYNAFKLFCTDLGNALHAVGKQLMIDLPPIGNATMQGYYLLKYEDFNSLPVDYLVVMAYDYQYDYGAGESVAPTAFVESICDWAKTKITDWENKLVIGMPAYGYHGTTGGYTITIDTKLQSSLRAGYSTATRNADGEMHWAQSGVSNFYQDTVGLNYKRGVIEAKGINYISVWHLGDNDWFTGTEPTLGEVTTSRIISGKANIAGTTNQTITGVANIIKAVNQTVEGVANIQKAFTETITGKARIGLVTQRTITGIARIFEEGFTSTTRAITGKANIINDTTRTIQGKASISGPVQRTITGKSRIVEAQDTELRIDNNIIVDPIRETAIGAIYDQLAGLTFYPFSADDGGLAYLEVGDRIIVKDRNDEEFEVVVFNIEINVNTGITEKISAKVPTKTASPYDRAGFIGQIIRNTEIKVDKQNGEIALINSNLTTNYYTKEETTAQIVLTTQDITTSVQNISTIAQAAMDQSEATSEQVELIETDLTVLQQTATDLSLKVESSGGVNLLKNSVGLKGTIEEWQLFDSEGDLIDARNTAMVDQGTSVAANSESGSAIIIANQFITQSFHTIVGREYTLLLKFNKVGSCDITLTGVGELPLTAGSYTDGTYAVFKYPFTATDVITTLRFENGDGESAILTDIIVKLGDASGWDQAPNEVYGSNFKFDKDGFSVSSLTDAFKTVLNNRSLAAYDTSGGTDKTMMNVDIYAALLTKLIAQDEFTLRRYNNPAASMRMIPVEDGVFLVIND